MNKEAIYRILPKQGYTVEVFDTAERVGRYMLGKRIAEYICVKEDAAGLRVVSLEKPDLCDMDKLVWTLKIG